MMLDPWTGLRRHTPARIALGRAGGSLPTAELLAFAADHANARDAVGSEWDVPALQEALGKLGLPVLALRSRAADRETYLKRPDLGRRLDEASVALLQADAPDEPDVCLIIGDGLSAIAGQRHAAIVLEHLLPLLKNRQFKLAPICLVTRARVAIEDEIGSLLHAKLSLILIGERPGLGCADSLGAYLLYEPKVGKTDAERNCISNIRPEHFGPAAAADAITWLIEQSLVRRMSGVGLKDDRQLTTEGGSRSQAGGSPSGYLTPR